MLNTKIKQLMKSTQQLESRQQPRRNTITKSLSPLDFVQSAALKHRQQVRQSLKAKKQFLDSDIHLDEDGDVIWTYFELPQQTGKQHNNDEQFSPDKAQQLLNKNNQAARALLKEGNKLPSIFQKSYSVDSHEYTQMDSFFNQQFQTRKFHQGVRKLRAKLKPDQKDLLIELEECSKFNDWKRAFQIQKELFSESKESQEYISIKLKLDIRRIIRNFIASEQQQQKTHILSLEEISCIKRIGRKLEPLIDADAKLQLKRIRFLSESHVVNKDFLQSIYKRLGVVLKIGTDRLSE